jgi:hypothetical protein
MLTAIRKNHYHLFLLQVKLFFATYAELATVAIGTALNPVNHLTGIGKEFTNEHEEVVGGRLC